jgi:hypothetical protein
MKRRFRLAALGLVVAIWLNSGPLWLSASLQLATFSPGIGAAQAAPDVADERRQPFRRTSACLQRVAGCAFGGGGSTLIRDGRLDSVDGFARRRAD